MNRYQFIPIVILSFFIMIIAVSYSKIMKKNKDIESRVQELENKINNTCHECGVVLTAEKTKTIECYDFFYTKENYCKKCAPPYDAKNLGSYYKKISVDENGNDLSAPKKIK